MILHGRRGIVDSGGMFSLTSSRFTIFPIQEVASVPLGGGGVYSHIHTEPRTSLGGSCRSASEEFPPRFEPVRERALCIHPAGRPRPRRMERFRRGAPGIPSVGFGRRELPPGLVPFRDSRDAGSVLCRRYGNAPSRRFLRKRAAGMAGESGLEPRDRSIGPRSRFGR